MSGKRQLANPLRRLPNEMPYLRAQAMDTAGEIPMFPLIQA